MTPKDKQPLPFYREMNFEYGVLQQVAPGLRRLVCHNPGPFTFKGTNSYILGKGEVAVVDPGPPSGEQLEILAKALAGETISHILITHCHGDHSGAAVALKERTGAILCGMPRGAGDPATGPSGRNFIIPVEYDRALKNGDRLAGREWEVEAVHTPGHAPDHLCFRILGENILLSGDHVMGWNTTIVAPPEGHMGSYIRSLELLMEGEEATYFPGHGGPVSEPRRFVKALIFHRLWRENEIAECLRDGLATISQMVPRMYAGLDPSLMGAASLAVFAQIEFMIEKGLVAPSRFPIDIDQQFALTGKSF